MKRDELSQALRRQMADVQVSPQLRRQTLDAVQGRETPIMKKKLSAALIAALMIIALAAVALAAAGRSGMLDFLSRYQGTYIPDNAGDYITNDVATLEEDAFTVSVRELYYDGRTARMTVDVTPKDAKTLLLGPDCSMLDSWQSLAQPLDGGWDESDTRTVLDVYRASGCTAAYRVNVFTADEAHGIVFSGSMDYTLGEDGTLTVYKEQSYDADLPERDITLSVDAIPFADPASDMLDMDARRTVSQRLSLTAAAAAPTAQAQAEVYVSAEPVLYESIGVRVDSVRIEVKPLELYATVEYTVVDKALFAKTDGGLWFEFINPDSTAEAPYDQRLTAGLSSGGTSYPTDGDLETATHFIQQETLGKNELADSYTLRAFECWNKQRFDTHTFDMLAQR